MDALAKYTDDELLAELNRRYHSSEVFEKSEINGITVKDLAVRYGHFHKTPSDDPRYTLQFKFYIRHEGVLYDADSEFQGQPWWPTEDEGDTAFFRFVPSEFYGFLENCFIYNRRDGDPLACLREHGFADIAPTE